MILRSDKKAGKVTPGGKLFRPLDRCLLLVVLLLVLPLFLAAEFQTHTVKKGDTLFSLSKRYGVSVNDIKKLNNLSSNNLSINQVLKIKEIKAPVVTPAPKPPAEKPAEEEAPQPAPPAISNLPEDYYYTVQAKDNLYRISVNNKLSLNDLLKWNKFADETHVIHPGDKLVIKDPGTYQGGETITETPPAEIEPENPAPADTSTVVIQKVYVVQKKDTLFRIAKNNGMTVDELKRLNNLTSNSISVGQKLYLAGTPSAETPVKPLTQEDVEKSTSLRGDLIMPTNGIISSEFGLRNGRPHKGIDIANKAGTPIYAVLDGVVVFSGVQSGYGNVVVIEHPDFVMTVYAHNERNVVKVDDRVTQGQLIAYMGSTGQSTGNHCHFEYRIKGKAINPRKVLPLK